MGTDTIANNIYTPGQQQHIEDNDNSSSSGSNSSISIEGGNAPVPETTPRNLDPFAHVYPYVSLRLAQSCCMQRVFGALNTREYHTHHKPLGLVPSKCRFRVQLVRVLDSTLFRAFIVSLILLNALLIALDDPLSSKPNAMATTASVSKALVTVVFTFEAVLKILAKGFIMHPYSYLRDGWNVIDFIVVVLCLGDFSSALPQLHVSAFRIFRLVRLIEIFRTTQQLRTLINAVLSSITYLLNSILIIVFVVFLFATLALQMWAGKLSYRCFLVDPVNGTEVAVLNDTRVCSPYQYIGRQCGANQTCVFAPDGFRPLLFRYDTFYYSVMTSLKVVSLDRWDEDVAQMMDSSGWFAWLFFCGLTLLGNYCAMNLITAVLTLSYAREADRSSIAEAPNLASRATPAVILSSVLVFPTAGAFPTRTLLHAQSYGDGDNDSNNNVKGHDRVHRGARRVVHAPWFMGIGVALTLVTIISSSMVHYGAPSWVDRQAVVVNMGCTIYFTVEAIVKIFGLGPRTYAADKFNVLDFFVVIISLPDLVLMSSTGFGAFRAMRLVRLFALFERWSRLQALLRAINASLEGFAYLLVLIALTVCSFGVVGVSLFEKWETRPHSFHTTLESLKSSFVIMTGDRWAETMQSVAQASGHYWTIAFFFPLFFIGRCVLMPLLVALLVDSIDQAEEEQEIIDADRAQEEKEGSEGEEEVGGAQPVGKARRESMLAVKANNLLRLLTHVPEQSNKDKNTNRRSARSKRRTTEVGLSSCTELIPMPQRLPRNSQRSNGSRDDDDDDILNETVSCTTIASSASEEADEGPQTVKKKDVRRPPPIVLNPLLEEIMFSSIFNTAGAPPSPAAEEYATSRNQLWDTLSESDIETIMNKNNMTSADEGEDELPFDGIVVSELGWSHIPVAVLRRYKDHLRCCAPDAEILQAGFVTSLKYQTPYPRRPVRENPSSSSVDSAHEEMKIAHRLEKKVLLDGRRSDAEPLALIEFEPAPNNFVLHFVRSIARRLRDAQRSKEWVPRNFAFGCIRPTAPLRQICVRLVQQGYFETFIVLIIIMSCVLTLADSPGLRDDHPGVARAFTVLDGVFVAVFVMEVLVKMMAMGVVGGDGAYFKSGWNTFDFVVVCLSLVAIIVLPQMVFFRSLRVFRLVAKLEQLKVVLSSLTYSVPALATAMFVLSLVLLQFSILGVQLFQGALHSCTNPEMHTKADCHGMYNVTLSGLSGEYNATREAVWADAEVYRFDTVASAFYTLLVLSFGAGWSDAMQIGIDSSGSDEGSSRNARPHMAIYFIVFALVGYVFCMRLFIAVLISSFHRMKELQSGAALLTFEQREWVTMQKYLEAQKVQTPVKEPKVLCARWCYRLATHKAFDALVQVIIVGNAVLLTLTHDGQTADFDRLMSVGNVVFIVLFTLEFVIKIVGLGPKGYFARGWNRFDTLVVLESWISIVALREKSSVGRMFRALRLVRLIRTFETMSVLFTTLYYAIPSLLNITLFVSVVVFVYAVIGMALYEDVDFQGPMTFRTVPDAIVVLYVMGSGSAWTRFMALAGPKADGGWRYYSARIYFTSYMFFGHVLCLNLFIAVLIQCFRDSEKEHQYMGRFSVIWRFREKWLGSDPDRTLRLPAATTLSILRRLPPLARHDVALASSSGFMFTLRQLQRMHINVGTQLECDYADIVRSLSMGAFGLPLGEGLEAARISTKVATPLTGGYQLYHHVAAIKLQSFWRRNKRRLSERLMRHNLVDEQTRSNAQTESHRIYTELLDAHRRELEHRQWVLQVENTRFNDWHAEQHTAVDVGRPDGAGKEVDTIPRTLSGRVHALVNLVQLGNRLNSTLDEHHGSQASSNSHAGHPVARAIHFDAFDTLAEDDPIVCDDGVGIDDDEDEDIISIEVVESAETDRQTEDFDPAPTARAYVQSRRRGAPHHATTNRDLNLQGEDFHTVDTTHFDVVEVDDDDDDVASAGSPIKPLPQQRLGAPRTDSRTQRVNFARDILLWETLRLPEQQPQLQEGYSFDGQNDSLHRTEISRDSRSHHQNGVVAAEVSDFVTLTDETTMNSVRSDGYGEKRQESAANTNVNKALPFS